MPGYVPIVARNIFEYMSEEAKGTRASMVELRLNSLPTSSSATNLDNLVRIATIDIAASEPRNLETKIC